MAKNAEMIALLKEAQALTSKVDNDRKNAETPEDWAKIRTNAAKAEDMWRRLGAALPSEVPGLASGYAGAPADVVRSRMHMIAESSDAKARGAKTPPISSSIASRESLKKWAAGG